MSSMSSQWAVAVQPREHGALVHDPRRHGVRRGPTPRTRGAPDWRPARGAGQGSNPANTGRSGLGEAPIFVWGVQPREHGALILGGGGGRGGWGPTPRTRGALRKAPLVTPAMGSNPANTGRSSPSTVPVSWQTVQPREHGALASPPRKPCMTGGPTPRTRGARLTLLLSRQIPGSNPANTGRSPAWPQGGVGPAVQPREHGALHACIL